VVVLSARTARVAPLIDDEEVIRWHSMSAWRGRPAGPDPSWRAASRRAEDLSLVAAVARQSAGRALGEVLGEPRLTGRIHATAAEALDVPCDVFVEYTKPGSAKGNILTALDRGAHVVVGTSGLTDADYAEIDAVARARRRGVLACGNFALTVVLLQKFAEAAARLIPQWEIIDYAHDDKVDVPSGTARELAFRLSKVRAPQPTSRSTRRSVRARPAAPAWPARRSTRSACPAT
jgi:4-hydroxy-tetrahydrodipicolinate reductase